GFARDRLCQKRFAGTGASDEEHALGDAPAQLREFLGISQELDDFLKLFLRLLAARDVGESELGVPLGQKLGARTDEGHRFAAAHLDLAQENQQQDQEDEHRAPADQKLNPKRVPLVDLVVRNEVVVGEQLHVELAVRVADGLEDLSTLDRRDELSLDAP